MPMDVGEEVESVPALRRVAAVWCADELDDGEDDDETESEVEIDCGEI